MKTKKNGGGLEPGDTLRYHRQMLHDARNGDVSAARDMLQTFLTCLDRGNPLPEPIKLYLYGAIASYLNGEQDVARALLLVAPDHRPQEVDRLILIRISRRRRRRTANGIKTAPLATTVKGKRPQSWIVARVFQRMASKDIGKEKAMAWASDRYTVSFDTLRDYCKGASDAFRDPERRKRLIYVGRWRARLRGNKSG